MRLLVPFGARGAADHAARAYAGSLSGVAVEVENIAGEGGLAGVRRANALARAGEPVLLLATPSTHVLLPARVGPDAAPDAAFEPLAGLGQAPNVLLASPRLGVAAFAQWLERARGGGLVYASAGTGQTIHLCTAYLCELAGVRMTHRPYDRGSAHAYHDLVAGRVQVYFDNLLGCRDAIGRGEAVALAISAEARHPLLPRVPTLAECGFPEHALEVWFGVFSANLGAAMRERIDASRDDGGLRRALASLGIAAGVGAGPALANAVRHSRAGWQRALDAAR